MLTLRYKLLTGLDRLLALILTALLLGTALAFGGGVWWARPVIASLAFALVLAWLGRSALAGPWRIHKSPLTALGMMGLMVGVIQLLPWPAALIERVSPRSMAVVSLGMIPELGLRDDPSAEIPPPFLARSPVSLDRSATLRWVVGAAACLGLFVVASHFADRLGKARVIWGSVVAAFLVNVVLGGVQVASLSGGLYGMFTPGSAPAWAPTLEDAMTAPSAMMLRPLGELDPGGVTLAAAHAERPFLVGSLMGGPGAFLGLASLALPLAFGLMLQMISPRGLRQGLFARLRDSGQGSLVLLMLGLIVTGAVLVGVMGGRMAAGACGIGLLLAGLAGTWSSGVRKTGLAATILVLASLAGGVALGECSVVEAPLPKVDWPAARATWAEAIPILRDFPVLGTGLGSFPVVHPYYKARDAARNTAMSSVLQWAVESGAVGVGLLLSAGLWCLVRLPGAIRRVGTADRALAFGLLGSLVGFVSFSCIHWTVELPAIALGASAVAGTANRWLAGGTDLFVDRG